MRLYYDAEFLENGKTIDLISIGMVTDDGHEYYAVNRDMPVRRIRRHQWLMDNVVPGLPKGSGDMRNSMGKRWLFHYGDPAVKEPETIARQVHAFIRDARARDEFGEVELWADYGAYDHVVLAQLYGPMILLPGEIPMFTHDLQQEQRRLQWIGRTRARALGVPAQEAGHHNALADARHNRVIGQYLQALAAELN